MELPALHRHGWAVSALAREFGLSRITFRRQPASACGLALPAASGAALGVPLCCRDVLCSLRRGVCHAISMLEVIANAAQRCAWRTVHAGRTVNNLVGPLALLGASFHRPLDSRRCPGQQRRAWLSR